MSTNRQPKTDRVSQCAAGLGILALGLGLAAVVSGWAAWAPGETAFRVFLGASAGTGLALVLGLLGWWRCRGGRRRGLGPARLSVAVAGLWVLAVVFSALAAWKAPLINDVSTDLADPPAFAPGGDAARAAEERGSSLAYPAAFAAVQREHYPDLATLRFDGDVASVRERVRRAMTALGWVETYVASEGRHIEATETSRIFRFTDDIVVRLQVSAGQVALDIRSRSRVGRGDLGANAARIRAFASELRR